MKRRIRKNPELPLTDSEWEEIYQGVCDRFREPDQPQKTLYSAGYFHHDSHLLVAGKNGQPMYLVLIALGPLDGESLVNFFLSKVTSFTEITCWGHFSRDFPWSVAGAMPEAQILTIKERTTMLALLQCIVKELEERFLAEQKNN
jgi:hypothetical protein